MATVQHVGRKEVVIVGSEDPVAARASWEPLARGGANFKTRALKAEGGCLKVVHSGGSLLFGGVFVVFGVIGLAIGLGLLVHPDGETAPGIMLTVWALLFGGVGGFVAFGGGRLTFDRSSGMYWQGRQAPARTGSAERAVAGYLDTIHALQVLPERVVSQGKHGTSVYSSYELNLVFKDGTRLNVMDHGNREALMVSAEQLADYLSVPVWQLDEAGQ